MSWHLFCLSKNVGLLTQGSGNFVKNQSCDSVTWVGGGAGIHREQVNTLTKWFHG